MSWVNHSAAHFHQDSSGASVFFLVPESWYWFDELYLPERVCGLESTDEGMKHLGSRKRGVIDHRTAGRDIIMKAADVSSYHTERQKHFPDFSDKACPIFKGYYTPWLWSSGAAVSTPEPVLTSQNQNEERDLLQHSSEVSTYLM